jgi:hypothetical protein
MVGSSAFSCFQPCHTAATLALYLKLGGENVLESVWPYDDLKRVKGGRQPREAEP